jgi:hypothetical protein
MAASKRQYADALQPPHQPHQSSQSTPKHPTTALVGETLESGGAITGARVVDKSKNRRPEYRLEVWTRSKVSDGCGWKVRRLIGLIG